VTTITDPDFPPALYLGIYLAGPINGCTDDEAVNWRDIVKQEVGEAGCIDPMRRDFRGQEDEQYAAIVTADKDDIQRCGLVMANCWQPSVGTSMEIMYAHEHGKPIIAVHPFSKPASPWIRYHCYVAPNLSVAIQWALRRYREGVQR
jgi:nucleoside 2-deoxyribosyltransferase